MNAGYKTCLYNDGAVCFNLMCIVFVPQTENSLNTPRSV